MNNYEYKVAINKEANKLQNDIAKLQLKIRIKENIPMYIYQSGSNKSIVGMGLISKFEFLKVNELYERYKEKLILTHDELIKYSEGRENKSLLVIHLENITKFNTPKIPKKSITMAGQYITEENKHIFLE